MKKLLVLITLVLIITSAGFAREKKFFAGADMNLMFHADSNFEKVYSKTIVMPEFKAGYYIGENLFIWGSYGFFKKNGETEGLGIKTEAKQSFLSFGAGYTKNLCKKSGLTFMAGLCNISYEEKALGEKVDGSKLGFRADLLFQYNLSSSVYSEIGAGYIGASDSLDNGVDFKLGGFRLLAGIGIRF